MNSSFSLKKYVLPKIFDIMQNKRKLSKYYVKLRKLFGMTVILHDCIWHLTELFSHLRITHPFAGMTIELAIFVINTQ